MTRAAQVPRRLVHPMLVIALVAGGLGLAGLVAAPAQAAASIMSTTLENTTKVTSTTGHALKLGLVDDQAAGSDTTVEVSLGTRDNYEQHSWSFELPAAASLIDRTGAGTLKATSTQMHGYGRISLTSQRNGPKHVTSSCGGDPVVAHRAVTLTGKLLIVTKSSGTHKWGSVGSATRKFHFSARSRVTWEYFSSKCTAGPLSCSGYLDWQAFVSTGTSGYLALTGGKNGKHYYLDGQRNTPLPHTGLAVTRFDFVASTSEPLTFTVGADGSAMLKVRAGAGGSGSARIDSPAASTSSYACGTAGQSVSAKEWDGSWTNGATPLRLHAQIFGALTVPDGSDSGRIYRNRVLPAP